MRGEDHLKRRSSSPRLPTLLGYGCAPKAHVKLSPAARETRREFPLAHLSIFQRIPGEMRENRPAPNFLNRGNPGRGLGRGQRRGSAALPNAQSAASLRRDAHPAGEWRAWGEQPAALEPVLPPHPVRKPFNPKYKPTTTEKHLLFPAISAFSAAFSLTPQAQRKPIAAAVPAADNPKKKRRKVSPPAGGAAGLCPPPPPPFEKGGRKLKRGTAKTLAKAIKLKKRG